MEVQRGDQVFWDHLGARPCFLYATILTERDRDLIPHIVLSQTVLVEIWRSHIKKYLYNDLGTDPPGPGRGVALSTDVSADRDGRPDVSDVSLSLRKMGTTSQVQLGEV